MHTRLVSQVAMTIGLALASVVPAVAQAQTASAARKKRDLRVDRLVILVAATHANRRALAEAEAISSGSFPMRTKAALSALATGSDPGADCLVVL